MPEQRGPASAISLRECMSFSVGNGYPIANGPRAIAEDDGL